MSYRTHAWILATVLCGLAAPARSQNACATVNQFTATVVFTGSSLQAFTGNSQQAVNWTYDYTNSRQAFQYLASNGSVTQTALYLYDRQLQYVITPSSGRCEMSPLPSRMPQAVVPGSFLSATNWTIGGSLTVTGYLYDFLFPFGPILPNVPTTSSAQPLFGQQVELVVSQNSCIPVSWTWNWGLAAVVAEFRNYVPSVNSSTFTPPQNCTTAK